MFLTLCAATVISNVEYTVCGVKERKMVHLKYHGK